MEPDIVDLRWGLDRRSLLRDAATLGLAASPLSFLLAGCGGQRDEMMGDGDSPDWMMSRGMDDSMMADMPVIHDLLAAHDRIRRDVEDLPGGIRARTTSSDSEIAGLIRRHVDDMATRVREGRPIRQMDPLFREIFAHHEEIDLRVDEVDGGVLVAETSQDPQVVLLIRQHARRAVTEFVRDGMSRAMKPTPLPTGYRS